MVDVVPVLPWIKPGWNGVEIGVFRGASSLRLLEHGVGHLYAVDPWEPTQTFPDYAYNRDEEYQDALRRLRPFIPERCTVLRHTSKNAATLVPDEVDFVWIDGNHRYKSVLFDMVTYWPKVHSGGVLCGHDYLDDIPDVEVKRAVDWFGESKGLKVIMVSAERPCWIIVKGC